MSLIIRPLSERTKAASRGTYCHEEARGGSGSDFHDDGELEGIAAKEVKKEKVGVEANSFGVSFGSFCSPSSVRSSRPCNLLGSFSLAGKPR